MVTLDSIKVKIAKLEKQALAIAEKQSAVGLEKIRGLMHKHGLSVADIESFVGKKRGRKPSAKTANGAAKSARGATKSVAPKYVDPKSGATWSGRGRAPAWIKDVKDRSRFLIDGSAGQKAGGTKAAAAKKAPAKRAAVKKVGRKAVVAKKASAQGRAAARKKAAPARKSATGRKVAARKGASAAVNAAAPAAES
ncbi:H-NS histone family protein [Paraburkholderia dinghuensis]|uniref:H-NS histone family protein n=1 Tax=Paraburkholderia dinghuensis TaxID=2305225 RepID=A0A3N6PPM6_9BURK|nr:H-NS histone family protein [Paraburkholderia dinghuensis]RQH01146.1 H-NS histone family protein [Paraburkholderia dinghuensis]